MVVQFSEFVLLHREARNLEKIFLIQQQCIHSTPFLPVMRYGDNQEHFSPTSWFVSTTFHPLATVHDTNERNAHKFALASRLNTPLRNKNVQMHLRLQYHQTSQKYQH